MIRSRAYIAIVFACIAASAFAVDEDIYLTNNVRVMRVNPNTGQRFVLSDDTVGVGPVFNSPAGLVVNAQSGYIYVAQPEPARIFRVEMVSGDRVVVSENGGLFTGPGMTDPVGISLGADGDLYTVEPESRRMFRIGIATGNRTLISGDFAGSGDGFLSPRALDQETSGSFVVVDAGLKALMRVDPLTGERRIISDATHASGYNFKGPRGVAIRANNQILVTDSGPDDGTFAVVAVDPATGDRSLFAGPSNGAGTSFTPNISDIAVSNAGFIAAADSTLGGASGLGALVNVDFSGNRSVLSGPGVGFGPVMGDNFFLRGPRYIDFGPALGEVVSGARGWNAYK